MGEGVSPPVLDGDSFPVGNNSMPPVASPRLGTSGCDCPSRIEFDKKRIYSNAIASLSNALAVWYTGNARYLDLGGYAVALYELVTGVDFIERVRKDFIVGKFDSLINQ